MHSGDTNQKFDLPARSLHWVIATSMLGLIWLGWYMVDLTYYDRWYNDALSVHKVLGMFVLVLAIFKSVWMRISPVPQPLPTLKRWEYSVSKLVHRVLFLAMFLLPVTGYLISTSEGDGISIFGWFEIPALFSTSAAVRDVAIEIHFYAAYAVLGIALLHGAAALKHQFIDKDGTLRRMV